MCALLVGDVRKLIDDLNYCADHGKLARKKVLFNFISGAVRSVRLDGRGVIYHEPTHRMFGMIKHYGGPRTHRFIQGNLAGMHLRTTERRCVKERCALCGIGLVDGFGKRRSGTSRLIMTSQPCLLFLCCPP